MMANLKLMQVVLQESTNVLRDKLKPEEILICLQQKGVLDKDDVQKITSERTDAEKVIALLDQLRFKPEFKYALFMETLEQVDKQLHWKVKVIERKHNYNPPAAQHYGDSAEATNQTSDQSGLSDSQQSNEKEDILIQTFTKWANTQLNDANEQIDNLEEDFWNGPKLTALIEVLLQKGKKEMDSVNQKAVMLKVMQQLFLSFTTFGSNAGASQTKESKRDQLLSWVQEQIPDCNITNFTSDWTDGKAVGALVNKFAPGACCDWESWEEDYATRNIEEAMKMAEDWLQIAQVITASDMQSGKADEICVMAYLAQFCSCTETEVPIGPRKPVVNELNIGTTEMTVNWCHRPRPVIQPVYEYQVEYVEGAGRRAGGPAGHWKKHPDQIPHSIFTCTVKELDHYQQYAFCVRGLHDGSKYGPISPLSDLAITTPNLDLRNIRAILMEATEKLCGFLDPYYVIENMYARRMLTFADKQKIKSIQAFSEKVDFCWKH
ncbi:dystrophin-like isoform X1 [Amphiura filiformis]|uniref:dystrophin-like isoform X1 n=1 Tax=Amphiura filiformis TaxID=82378 RepID=UPI003B219F9B